MVFGTAGLGVSPALQVRGQVIDSTAAVSTPNDGAADAGSGVLGSLGDEVPAAVMVADQTTYEQREAQFTTALPDQRAQVAIRTAMAQIGLPYVWGGDGPTNGDAGFDCSGLTTFSYAAAGVSLPRTAHTQYYTGPHVPQDAPLQPGDLVFYGTPAKVHHVGMYLGDGKMVNAPTFGKPVQVAFFRYGGDDYLGATRPAATGTTTGGLLPYAPAAPSTDVPEPFPAPVAPVPTTIPDATVPQQPAAVVAPEVTTAATVTSTVSVAPTTTVPVTPSTSVRSSASSTSTPRPTPSTSAVTVTVTAPPSSSATTPASPSASASSSQSSTAPADSAAVVTTTTPAP